MSIMTMDGYKGVISKRTVYGSSWMDSWGVYWGDYSDAVKNAANSVIEEVLDKLDNGTLQDHQDVIDWTRYVIESMHMDVSDQLDVLHIAGSALGIEEDDRWLSAV